MPKSVSSHLAPHRREIDGLRSIAVLAVVLHHFGVPGLRGGFVGVDIFFVISGFLIGGILWRDLREDSQLSLVRFYLRRIRRLAPAYFAMAAASLLVGMFVLLPYEFREFGKGLIAATVYLSNVLFFRQAGYFDSASEDKIFLHTWSLSVEEQFYLFLPLVFVMFGRSRPGLIWAMGALAVVSLLGCIWLTPQNQTATFYLFPFRAWELLAGVLLAVIGIERSLRWSFGPLLSWVGLALVLAGIFLLSPGAGFPGWQAGVPVLGTVLLILNGRNANPVNRLLSMKGPVWVGLISYSLYLWHWPVMTFSTYWRGSYSGPIEVAGWIALSFVLAYLSWRFVEQPVRISRIVSSRWLIGGTVAASATMLMAGAVIYTQDGMINRFKEPARTHIAATGDFLQDWSRCHVANDGPLQGIETCPIGPEGARPDLVIWGDSHVRAFYEGLALAASQQGRAGLVIWRAGCAPLFDLEKDENSATQVQNRECRVANDQIRTALDGMTGLKDILLIGRWSYYATGTGVGLDADNEIRLSGSKGQAGSQADLFSGAMRDSLDWMSQRAGTVFVLRQVPEVASYDARVFARALAHGGMGEAERKARQKIELAQLTMRNAVPDQVFAGLQQNGVIRLLDSWPYFCDPKACHAVHQGVGQYFDNNHITNAASRRVRGLFAPVFGPDGQSNADN